jgi:glucosamine 6-phosphate synthetase-like amidotransferase/phosphosugar isomerase protein
MLVLDDDNVVEVRPEGVRVTHVDGTVWPPRSGRVEWDLEAAEKGGYETFMLKEIHEQSTAIADTLRGRIESPDRITLRELQLEDRVLRMVDKVFVIACGTSYPRRDDGQVRDRTMDPASGGDRHRLGVPVPGSGARRPEPGDRHLAVG